MMYRLWTVHFNASARNIAKVSPSSCELPNRDRNGLLRIALRLAKQQGPPFTATSTHTSLVPLQSVILHSTEQTALTTKVVR